MTPLSIDDLMPLEEYVARRAELFAAFNKYLDRCRRIRIGPQVTLVFENRQTLWHRLQELLRVARLADPVRVQQELDWYNRLLPRPGHLCAALLIAAASDAEALDRLRFWQGLSGESIRLRVGDAEAPATLVTCRPEDRAVGLAHWLQFAVGGGVCELLMDEWKPAWVEIDFQGYRHTSAELNPDMRQSLIDDLVRGMRD